MMMMIAITIMISLRMTNKDLARSLLGRWVVRESRPCPVPIRAGACRYIYIYIYIYTH